MDFAIRLAHLAVDAQVALDVMGVVDVVVLVLIASAVLAVEDVEVAVLILVRDALEQHVPQVARICWNEAHNLQ